MLSRTTEELALEHSTPLTTSMAIDADVWPTAVHAEETGIVGLGELGVAGVLPPPPPPQAAHSTSRSATVLLLILVVRVRQVRKRRAGEGRQHARLHIREQLRPRVDDIEVAHRQLSDAILRGEHRLPFFHREPFGLVGQVR